MRVIVVLLFTLLFISVAPAADITSLSQTIIHDEAEAELLLGNHSFTTYDLSGNNWGGYKHFGTAIVTQQNGLYKIKGRHDNYWLWRENAPQGGWVTIEGVITSIETTQFSLKGSVVYHDTSFLKSMPEIECKFAGILVFKKQDQYIEDGKNYEMDLPQSSWRLMDSVCECGKDEKIRLYIDIFTSVIKEVEPSNPNRYSKLRKVTKCVAGR